MRPLPETRRRWVPPDVAYILNFQGRPVAQKKEPVVLGTFLAVFAIHEMVWLFNATKGVIDFIQDIHFQSLAPCDYTNPSNF